MNTGRSNTNTTPGGSAAFNKNVLECIVFGCDCGSFKVLFLKEDKKFNASSWRLPSVFVPSDDDPREAAEGMLADLNIKEKLFFDKLKSDSACLTEKADEDGGVIFFALIDLHAYRINFGKTDRIIRWVSIKDIPNLMSNKNQDLYFIQLLKSLLIDFICS